ncbi:single-stranded DNA-binding protein [Streptomyces sp. Wb2n-11]|uniref:single-stranded DNA-binding protein n=1 Tax=Streptomyces sp. Wb2n-11 TaxID=1030533 RepID=UPI000A74A206|nr:single-stranded DNA-binding protein [Streptomyces sp. Wb2n-11]
MSNPRNNGQLIGRLANDPKVFENKDGSKKVLFTVFADRAYTNAQNQRDSDAVPVEAFVRAQTQGLGPYSNIHKGDLVAVGYMLRMDRYSKNGEQVFDLKVISEDITFLESRSVTQARLNERVRAAEAQNQALQTPAAPVVAAAPAVAHVSAVDEQLPFP